MDKKNIGILTFRTEGIKPWNLDSPKEGMYGAEEAVVFMSQALILLGYQVIIFVEWEDFSPHSLPNANPRFIGKNSNTWVPLDIAISWRIPLGIAWLKSYAKQVYFWPHDACSYVIPEDEIHFLDGVLWVSHWQRKQWIDKNPKLAMFTQVFGNGIDPQPFHSTPLKANPYSCIYSSNYGLGLDFLLTIWPTIYAKFPLATLDIFYGWNHFGLLTPEKEKRMKTQITELTHLNVKEHGQVGQDKLNHTYEQSSLWTYPCTGSETFCMTALRAQFAGAIPVIIEGSALTETVRHGYKCQFKEQYVDLLIQAMSEIGQYSLQDRKQMRNFILKEFTWDIIAQKWHILFNNPI